MGVGTFPGLVNSRRRTVRAPTNPADKCTIYSIFPKSIHEVKPTISPGVFDIPAGSEANPACVIVGSSSWWKEVDEEQPLLEIPNYSSQVAEAIVRDYCNGLLGCDMGNAMPGLFWVPGQETLKALTSDPKIAKLFDAAKVKQKNFWQNLVKLADGLWARTNGNPLVIADDMRIAARELNLIGKEWMKDFTMSTKVPCKACGTMVSPDYPVCPTCKAIVNEEQAKTLGIKFAL